MYLLNGLKLEILGLFWMLIVLCRQTNPLDYVTELIKYIPKDFDGTFWILPAPFS